MGGCHEEREDIGPDEVMRHGVVANAGHPSTGHTPIVAGDHGGQSSPDVVLIETAHQ
jgi:hypothetical protein